MTIAAILLMMLAIAVVIPVVLAGLHGSRGPRYMGEAPHKGPVMRFTGTSSEVKHDSGNQRDTRV